MYTISACHKAILVSGKVCQGNRACCRSLRFLQISCSIAVPLGATVISPINHSMRSYATAIIAAEHLVDSVQEMAGFVCDPLTGNWTLSDDTSVNFIAFGTKRDK
ncbi:Zinc finger protein [Musa troglodytarum]|uniref:Zinc finger protein n=1 Tax=Musa troglodytarum TaxID=320322 RepID=A0A9E7JE78_9LILI|nr:Zinc finger protein [Musa troglodytarum]